ncbi:MAG: glycerol-3-phosphate 1-O-acyltransferase PlsY [Armatimonadota bacterium]|nr:glycerol-3-phosphate 1-O-acyltransferase PlsY [Armatimonadota bacterium]
MKIAAIMLACYLAGAIPFGLIVGLLKGIDIRKHGSGNIGATNVLRLLGPGPAAIVFIGDTLKGLFAVLLCKATLDPAALVVAGGLAGVLGHNFSIFLRFKGGKGVATSLGVAFGIDPVIAAITFGVWLVFVGIFRYISVASIIAALTVPAQMWFSEPLFGRRAPREYLAFAIVACAFIVVKHRSNIARLLAGNEPKVGQKAKIG